MKRFVRYGTLTTVLITLTALLGGAASAFDVPTRAVMFTYQPGYYVAGNGADDAAGTFNDPWRTVSRAVAAAPAGSRIYLRAGTYEPFTVARPGLSISGLAGERAVINGGGGRGNVVSVTASDVTLSNLAVTGCVPDPADTPNTPEFAGIRVEATSRVVVRNVVVSDGHGVNDQGLPIGCHGILVHDATDVTVTSSEVFHNGSGIVVSGGGANILVEENNVHDQDVIVRNTPGGDDDYGGYGLAATNIAPGAGPVFRNNRVTHNVGPSADYGTDGGGMEIYNASDITITDNTFADNDGVLETGTSPGGSCLDNVFANNTATGRSAGSSVEVSSGLILRCAANMAVRDNQLAALDRFVFLLASGVRFAAADDGLQITGNVVTQLAGNPVYYLQLDGGIGTGVTIDVNHYITTPDRFAVSDTSQRLSFSDWQRQTGYDLASTVSGPIGN